MTVPLVPFSQLIQGLPFASVLQDMLDAATALQFPVTAFQDGGAGNTFLQAAANEISKTANNVLTTVMGGFLDFAATVTPDPSVVGTSWSPGWLDVLASGLGVTNSQGLPGRNLATFAATSMSFTNTSPTSTPTFLPLTFHVSQGGVTYSNTVAFSIAGSSTTANIPFICDQAGTIGNATIGAINGLVTAIIGVTCTNTTAAVGQNAESNASLVSRCRSKLGALSPNGPKASYDYVSRSIPIPGVTPQLVSGLLTVPRNPVTRTKQILNTGTGLLTNYVASASGPYVAPDLYTGSANLTITAVFNTSPTQIGITAHGYNTGDNIYISGTGLAGLDGQTFVCTVLDVNHITVPPNLVGASSTGTAYRQSDLDLIDKWVQAFSVPFGLKAYVTSTAPANPITIAGTIVLRKNSTLTTLAAQNIAIAAIVAYFPTLPLGGNNEGSGQVFVKEAIRLAASKAFSPNDLLAINLTSPAVDVAVVTPQDVATINGPQTWTVTREV